MTNTVKFRERIQTAHQQMLAVSEPESQRPFREGGWSRKEILGHLIDSALNNHQRFVRAALEGSYVGPSYHQQGWVAMHGYKTMPWKDLLHHWSQQNELLAAVVDRIPQDRLDVQCSVGEYAPMTLQALVEDYLVHLEQHVQQIAAP